MGSGHYSNAYGQPVLKIRKDGDSGPQYLTWNQYDSIGRLVKTANDSALSGFDASYPDLVHDPANPSNNKVYTDQGLVEINRYFSDAVGEPTGQPRDHLWYTAVTNGEKLSSGATDHSQDIRTREWTYTDGGLAGDGIYFVASEIEYPSATAQTIQNIKTYVYDSWHQVDSENTNQFLQRTTKFAKVGLDQNGADGETTVNGSSENYKLVERFDRAGQKLWERDAAGYVNYTEYDPATGAIVKRIIDADPATGTYSMTGPDRGSGLPTALALTTTYQVDGLGRPTKVTDPNSNITYMVYDDTLDDNNDGAPGGSGDDPRDVRIYRGWNSSTKLPTGPVEVRLSTPFIDSVSSNPLTASSIEDSLTFSWAGSGGLPVNGSGIPTGSESLSSSDATIQSLTREWKNISGQTLSIRDYHSLAGATYNPGSADFETVGTAGTNFYETIQGFNSQGLFYKTKTPSGTWKYMTFDGRGLMTGKWLGTNNTNATEINPGNGGAGGNNLKQVSSFSYDDSNNLWKVESRFGDSTGNVYENRYRSDWRNRQIDGRGRDRVAEKVTLDNLGRAIERQTYVDSASSGTEFTIDSTELRGKTTSPYDAQGRVFRSEVFEVDPATGSSPGAPRDKLATSYWHDLRGNVIKSSTSNGLFTKSMFDGAGRITASHLSYQKDSLGNDTDTLFVDADDVTSDVVIEQRVTAYDKGGRPILQTLFERSSDSPATGALGTANSFIQTAATWYDAADRAIGTATFGRDNGTTRYVFNTSGGVIDINSNGVPDIAESANIKNPNTSDDYLAVKYEYDNAGRLDRTTDNKGHLTQRYFDLLGRQTKTVENFTGTGVVADTASDTNRTTEWIYDASGRLSTQRAKNPLGSGNGVENQDTTYLYGSPIDASWATSTIYPDSTDTTSSGTDQVKTEYDRLGRVTKSTDQRGVVHDYLYDGSGRLEQDVASSLGGSGSIDSTVRRIQYAFDDLSRVQTVSSYDATTSGNIVNQVKQTYDGWGNVIKSQQSHSGAVASGTLAIEYVYGDAGTGSGSAKYVRLEKMKYPSGREVNFGYGTVTTIDFALSRIKTISETGMSLPHSTYNFIGASRLISEDRANGVSKGYDDISTTNNIDGLDRFGRVTALHWGVVGDIYNDVSTYTYDRNSNRLTKGVIADGMSDIFQDEAYTYDGLDRLASFDREGKFSQTWSGSGATLDSLGNWRSQVTDTNGSASGGSVTQSRPHNRANEISGSITGNSPAWATPAHDAAGNMTAMPKPGSENTQLDAKYDAWNRMTQAKEGSTVTGTYEYDGFNRRIEKTIGSNTEHSYFSEEYQVLEVRKNASTEPLEQNIWGTQYVDELIVRDRDTIPDDGSLDTSFNSTGIVTTDFGADDYGQRMAVQSDGKILVAGWTTYYDATIDDYVSDFAVVRYRGDGTLDTSFDSDGKGVYPYQPSGVHATAYSYAIKVLSDGKIMIAGRTDGDTLLLKLNSNGSIDTSFDSDGWVQKNFGSSDGAFDMAIDASGKIVVAGYDNGANRWMVGRFNSNGSMDTTFGSSGEANISWGLGSNNKAYDLEIQSDGKIVIAGAADGHAALARLNSNGTLDTGFDSDGKVNFSTFGLSSGFMGLAIQGDGKYVGVGYSSSPTSVLIWDTLTARVTTSGALDTSFSTDGYDVYDTAGAYNIAGGAAVQPDGKIVVGSTVGTGNAMLLRYTASGVLDTTFDSDGVVETNIATGSADTWVGIGHTWDGKIVVSGYANGDFAAGRLNAGIGLDQRLYVQQDANYNVTSVSNAAGETVERYRFTPYGVRTLLNDDFTVDGDGVSDVAMDVGHQGLKHDGETNLIYNRARYLHSSLGRFVGRDPLLTAYQDGMNLYEYLRSRPLTLNDSMGTDAGGSGGTAPNVKTDPNGVRWVNTGIKFCQASAGSSDVFGHAYIMVDGVGYGYYANSHAGGSPDSSGGIGVIATTGVLRPFEERAYPPIPTDAAAPASGTYARCKDIWIPIRGCDDNSFDLVGKFRDGVLKEINRQAALGRAGFYGAGTKDCYGWACGAIDEGLNSVNGGYPSTFAPPGTLAQADPWWAE